VYSSHQGILFFSACRALSPNLTKSNDRHLNALFNITQNGKKSNEKSEISQMEKQSKKKSGLNSGNTRLTRTA
jgi:hypothetical protein